MLKKDRARARGTSTCTSRQSSHALALARSVAFAIVALTVRTAFADDHAEVSTEIFEEKRSGDKGGLSVIHPAADVGQDLGDHVNLDLGYSADAVSGATSPVYQVDAVSNATKFHDLRQQGNVALGFNGSRAHLTFTGLFGTERDYISRAIGANASIDLPGRNTTVAIAYSHSFDQVCDADNTGLSPLEFRALTGADPCLKTGGVEGKNDPGTTLWLPIAIDTAQATVTQNLTPTMNMQVAAYGQVLDGFLSNPYRRVKVGGNSPQENIPDERARWSLTARLNRYLPQLHSAAHFEARFYDDTWRVIGGNLELGYSQYVGDSLLLFFHARVYQQSAASFFKDAFFYETESSAGAYYTGDRELSPVRSALVGAKIALLSVAGTDHKVWGLFDRLTFDVKGDVLFLSQLPADTSMPNPEGISTEFLYGNSFFDAVILQLSLLANY
ncbi:MAG TPA: DUF3570 domain-containing protein [Kofleriaceae bacterium]